MDAIWKGSYKDAEVAFALDVSPPVHPAAGELPVTAHVQGKYRAGGDSLEQALEQGFRQLDGFYTLLMATPDRLTLVRDAFACKPAVVAETDDYVAVSSEFRSLAHLPGITGADIFEPKPEEIYSWKV